MTIATIDGNVCAAPHLPAGILSPYRDGERGAVFGDFANSQRHKKGTEVAAGPFLPVTIRGEMSGRTMRGGADVNRGGAPMRGLHHSSLGPQA